MDEEENRTCGDCAYWVCGGMCRLWRVSKDGCLKKGVVSDLPAKGYSYLYVGAQFGCNEFRHGSRCVQASPSGFVFGSPWNIHVLGSLFMIHVPAEGREQKALFELVDFLNTCLVGLHDPSADPPSRNVCPEDNSARTSCTCDRQEADDES